MIYYPEPTEYTGPIGGYPIRVHKTYPGERMGSFTSMTVWEDGKLLLERGMVSPTLEFGRYFLTFEDGTPEGLLDVQPIIVKEVNAYRASEKTLICNHVKGLVVAPLN